MTLECSGLTEPSFQEKSIIADQKAVRRAANFLFVGLVTLAGVRFLNGGRCRATALQGGNSC